VNGVEGGGLLASDRNSDLVCVHGKSSIEQILPLASVRFCVALNQDIPDLQRTDSHGEYACKQLIRTLEANVIVLKGALT